VKAAATALVLLALAACEQASGPGDRPPVRNSATTATPPSPSTGSVGQGQVPDTRSGQPAPPERFIVCPGNPRCPPEGSQPKGRQDTDH
jgi:hypothetical protein